MQIIAVNIERQHVDLSGNADRCQDPVDVVAREPFRLYDRRSRSGGGMAGEETPAFGHEHRIAIKQETAPLMMHQKMVAMQVRPSCELISTTVHETDPASVSRYTSAGTTGDRLPRIPKTG